MANPEGDDDLPKLSSRQQANLIARLIARMEFWISINTFVVVGAIVTVVLILNYPTLLSEIVQALWGRENTHLNVTIDGEPIPDYPNYEALPTPTLPIDLVPDHRAE